MKNTLLKMIGITKTFPGVVALDNVDFTLNKGEIHALMGENGAGKSTLIKVLTGVETFETGRILLNDSERSIVNRSPQEAQTRGISTVYQEINLCPNLSVAENLYLGRQPSKLGLVSWKEMNIHAQKVMDNFEIPVNVTVSLENYSVAIQQMVAIARAVDISAKILILDEPTSSLDEREVQKLFNIMRRLRNEGLGIIFVTHFLEQVYEVCDKITVLRNGGLVGEFEVERLPRVQLVSKMMGKEFDDLASIKNEEPLELSKEQETPLFSARQLGRVGHIKPFDLEIYPGEVIGFSGLLGSGRTELVRIIYGADSPDSGEMKYKGKKIYFKTPLDAMKKGFAFLPENRKEEGVIADLSVRENLIIALQAKKGAFKLISRKEQEKLADEYIKLLQIKTTGTEAPVKQLSGGNQQKVILGRWLMTNPELLILDEPTRGIDVGTKTEIQKLVLKLAFEGMCVIFISSEIEEMLRTVGRMGIMRDREKVKELSAAQLNQDAIMSAIAGGSGNENS
ncbi:MAG: sugar ABC transporter ATP-binding protein [Eubacterium sp.]|nr:sugar ABC transporter ATP-binding protein [Eubacterium sp.]